MRCVVEDVNILKSPNKPLYFALKEIDGLDRDTYQRELSALERTCAQIQKETHLIKLLLTFQHGENYYLLFEWADGNLEEFWKKNIVTPTLDTAKWAAEQCLGLANAIKRIHGLTTWQKQEIDSRLSVGGVEEKHWGRHGDLKPNNILWFAKYGEHRDHLVVSDLGLTRYHSFLTRSHVPRSSIEGCTWTYRPPEMDLGGNISQKYDIWSLGCVFLEFCTWYLEGIEGVEQFIFGRIAEDKSEVLNAKEDKYFDIAEDRTGHRVAAVKPVVEMVSILDGMFGYLSEWLTARWLTRPQQIERLRELSNSREFAPQMLDLIKQKMILVEANERSRIDLICTEIRGILDPLLRLPASQELSPTLAETSGVRRALHVSSNTVN